MDRPKGKYRVLVDDNFHYMDESERYSAGEFESCEQAIERCKRIVDEFLLGEHKPSMTAKELMDKYVMFGEDPFIMPEEAGCAFHAWDYARQRCEELCK